MHHEKLDGSGYPFGISAGALGEKERLLQCLDIYQAMREERPYKSALDHESAMDELRDMVRQGKLDGDIVRDIGICFASDDAVLAAG
jgi:HD-GYP domain-containing protein (c-di-GMP phosphodiesterase class II)